MDQYKDVPYFILLTVESPEVIICFNQKLLPPAILQFIHGILYMYYTINYAVLFLAFTDTNKGLLVTCIQDTIQGSVSVTALQVCNDSLVEQL